jgi:SAM-dependent methyltransferase
VTRPYRFAETNGVRIAFRPELEGGGRAFGRDFMPVVGHLFGHVGRLYEMCCGAGYIGFSLLALGHCDELVLSDINPEAIDAVNETIRTNGLEEKVTVYQSDALKDIPSEEKWDLAVSNPPHFPTEVTGVPNLLTDDVGWDMHRDFFNGVADHLEPGGSILFCENSQGGEPEVFLSLIEEAGLAHVRTIWYTGGVADPCYYFLWVKKALPGLAYEDEPKAAVLPLRDEPDGAVATTAGHSYSLRLVNETDRVIRPLLLDDSGTRMFWRPFEVMEPGAETQAPVVGLRAGKYEVRDRIGDTTLARMVVS